jgi:hypothetical protein
VDAGDGEGSKEHHQKRIRGDAKVEVEGAVDADGSASCECRGQQGAGEPVFVGVKSLQTVDKEGQSRQDAEQASEASALGQELQVVVLGVLDA